jgi:hypothetical protein
MIDFSSQAGAHVNYADLIVQVLPLDAYVIVYPPGRFGDGKKCCGGKPNLPMIMQHFSNSAFQMACTA